MTEHSDAVELLQALWNEHDGGPVPSPVAHLAALLQDSGEAGVRLWRQECENCGGRGRYRVHYEGRGITPHSEELTCPTCSGQGYVPRVSMLEQVGAFDPSEGFRTELTALEIQVRNRIEGNSPVDAYDLYRDRPIKEG